MTIAWEKHSPCTAALKIIRQLSKHTLPLNLEIMAFIVYGGTTSKRIVTMGIKTIWICRYNEDFKVIQDYTCICTCSSADVVLMNHHHMIQFYVHTYTCKGI